MIALAGLLGSLPHAAAAAQSTSGSVLCRSLHAGAQPTLSGLMQNDNLLEAANRAIARSNEDDNLFLRNAAVALARNLDRINQLLNDGFPRDTNAAGNASEDLMKTRLQAVASAQNDALNVIAGYVQTSDLTQARNEFPAGELATNEGLQITNDPGTPAAVSVSGERARNLASVLASVRSRIGDLEEPAGSAVVAAAAVCGSSQRPAPVKD